MSDSQTQGSTQNPEPSLPQRRAELTKEIHELDAQRRKLLTERMELDRRIGSGLIDDVADFVSGPVASDIEADKEEVAETNPDKGNALRINVGNRTLNAADLIYAVLCFVCAVFMVPMFVMILNMLLHSAVAGFLQGHMVVTTIIFVIECALMAALAAGYVYLGLGLVRQTLGSHKLLICEIMLILQAALFLCHIMLFGMGTPLVIYGLMTALLVAIHSYWDPELMLERANKSVDDRTLKEMLRKDDVERTDIPGKRSGKGYITLNFFNLFWIFTIASILGLGIEDIFHVAIFHAWQDRAGMLWGPLSPIYGFGATLMTIALNRFHNKPLWMIFLVSAVIGGAFEFFTSWFMQTAFGITAWNYSGTFLNIDGRTNFMFMCFWGLLGMVWVKLLLPIMLWAVKKIPWGLRYTLTTVCALFMIFDGAMTLTTIDCWYMREAHVPITNAVEQFCADHYDNEYMQNRFQTMTMNVNSTARTAGH